MQRCNGPCWRPQGSLERSIRTCWRLPPLPGAGGGLPCPRNDGLGRRDEGLPHVFLVLGRRAETVRNVDRILRPRAERLKNVFQVLGRRAETVRNVDRILRPRAERSKNVWPVLGSRAEHLKNVWQVLGRRAETMKILERQRGRCLVAGVWGRAVIGIRALPHPGPLPREREHRSQRRCRFASLVGRTAIRVKGDRARPFLLPGGEGQDEGEPRTSSPLFQMNWWWCLRALPHPGLLPKERESGAQPRARIYRLQTGGWLAPAAFPQFLAGEFHCRTGNYAWWDSFLQFSTQVFRPSTVLPPVGSRPNKQKQT